MADFFALLFRLSFILFIAGLLRPVILTQFHINNPTRKKALLIFGGNFLLFLILSGLIIPHKPKDASLVVYSSPTAVITAFPTVMPSPTITAETAGEFVRAERVIDGDTIRLDGGRVVRYIGIDTPETADPRKSVQCYAKEASAKNRELVEGKMVRLEKDVSETDKYGRLLRYVYLGDIMVNEVLVKEGYAHVSSFPPDNKFQEKFRLAEQKAREESIGLWGEVCDVSAPTIVLIPSTHFPSNTVQSVTNNDQPVNHALQPQQSGSYVCNCKKTCSQMSCAEAQYQLSVCGCTARDADKDGIACDSQCQ